MALKPDHTILLSFIPRLLRRHLKGLGTGPVANPSEQVQPAVLLFADVSGFTALSERLADQGSIGSERLTDYLNTYC